jgi:hypothetical protein
MVTTSEMDGFNFNRLYGNEKYNLQNMELKSVNFPAQAEHYHSIYEDRALTEWRKAAEGIESRQSGDAFWAGVSDKDVLVFAQRMADALSFKHKVTGARISRHTNWSSGYPILLLEMTSGGKNLRRPKSKRGDLQARGRYDGGYFMDWGPDDEDYRGM